MAVNGYFSIPTDTALAEVDPQQILRVAICEKCRPGVNLIKPDT